MAEDHGEALRYLREQRQMTQAQVASRAGCTKAQISRYERGGNLNVETLVRILRAMGWRMIHFGHAMRHVQEQREQEERGNPRHKHPPALAKAMCELRERAGLSQTEAASLADLRRQSWWYVENQYHTPTFTVLLRMLEAVGASLTELDEAMQRAGQEEGA